MQAHSQYSNAGGKFWKNLFMPHTILTDRKKEKDEREAKNAKIIEVGAKSVQVGEVQDAENNKMMYIGVGGLLVIVLGVGLYYAFKK
jgi:hypothetical protein